MSELELYKKAYATLVGRVDAAIDRLTKASALLSPDAGTGILMTALELANALQEAEEVIISNEL